MFHTLVLFQIAAKIGGDAPQMSNNGGTEGYPFTAQKRSLEDGGLTTDKDNRHVAHMFKKDAIYLHHVSFFFSRSTRR